MTDVPTDSGFWPSVVTPVVVARRGPLPQKPCLAERRAAVIAQLVRSSGMDVVPAPVGKGDAPVGLGQAPVAGQP